MQKADCKTAFGIIDESLLLTPEWRRPSLACPLSRRPDHSQVWIFGYGSLMWNPIFEAEDDGASGHNLRLSSHLLFVVNFRPQYLVAAGAHVWRYKSWTDHAGRAFRLPEDRLHEEPEWLWKREMLTGCYNPHIE